MRFSTESLVAIATLSAGVSAQYDYVCPIEIEIHGCETLVLTRPPSPRSSSAAALLARRWRLA